MKSTAMVTSDELLIINTGIYEFEISLDNNFRYWAYRKKLKTN